MGDISITDNKKSLNLPILYFVSGWIIYAVIYVLLKGFNATWAGILSFSTSLMFITISLSFYLWLYKHSTATSRRVFLFFAVSCVFILFDCLIYKISYNVLHIAPGVQSGLLSFLDNLAYMGFLLCQSIAFFVLLPKIRLYKSKFLNILLYFPIVVIVAIISTMFLLSSGSGKFSNFSLSKFYDLLEMILQLTGFIVAIFCLIVAKNKGVACLSLAYLAQVVVDLLLNTNVFAQTYGQGAFIETGWFLSGLFGVYGLIYFARSGIYKIASTDWVYSHDSIKSQTIFSNLIAYFLTISIIFLASVFFLHQSFFYLSKNYLQVFATTFIFFTVFWVIISSIFCERLYQPLRQLEAMGQHFMTDNLQPCLVDTADYGIYEFEQTREVLHKAFRLMQEKSMAEQELVHVAAQTAHDICSPIMALHIMMEQIPNLSVEQREFLEKAHHSIVEMAKNMLSKYREFRSSKIGNNVNISAVTSYNNQATKDVINLLTVVDVVAYLVRLKKMQFANFNINFEFVNQEMDKDLLIRVNTEQLQRILSNVINNAVEAILEAKRELGRVKIGLEVVDINEKKSNGFLAISIEDNGCGMSQELMDKIGNTEFSVGKADGTGMGLYTAAQCIRIWGGNYEITSTIGSGTKIIVRLPVV